MIQREGKDGLISVRVELEDTRRLFESHPGEWACIGYAMARCKSVSRRGNLRVRTLWRHPSGREVVMVQYVSVNDLDMLQLTTAARYYLRPRLPNEDFEAVQTPTATSAAPPRPPA